MPEPVEVRLTLRHPEGGDAAWRALRWFLKRVLRDAGWVARWDTRKKEGDGAVQEVDAGAEETPLVAPPAEPAGLSVARP